MSYAPVALFCYRRLDVLKQTVEALQKNAESKESLLFVFSDGFKNDEDKKDVEEVRAYLHTVSGFKKIEIFESPQNKGLANSIISGVTKVVNEYGKIIVVEDDILTSPYFLKYMDDALDMYENDDNVACISGYTYPVKTNKQTFFIKGSDCWGWATWKRAWDVFEPDGKKLLNEIRKKHLEKEFDFNNSYPYVQMLQDQIDGKNNSWAIRWLASCFSANKLCLYPGKSFVQNIGFGVEGATHCTSESSEYDVKINLKKIKLRKIDLKEDLIMRKKFSNFWAKQRGIILSKVTYTFAERLFSIKNNPSKTRKIITILGAKIKIKKKGAVNA